MLALFAQWGSRTMTDSGIRAIRNFVVWTVLRVVGLIVALVALVGIFIPWLVNAHNDAFMGLAILLAIGTPVVMVIVGAQLVLDVRRFPAKFHEAEGEPR
jgi:hypothetical protein